MSGWLGGLVGGVIATLTSALCILWFFVEPTHSFAVDKVIHYWALLVFIAVGCFNAYVHHRLQATHEQLLAAQQKLQQSLTQTTLANAYLKAIFEQSPLGIALIDSASGRIAAVNQSFAVVVGRAQADLVNMDWMSLNHPDDLQAEAESMARLKAGAITVFHLDRRYLRPDQSSVWVSMTVVALKVESGTQPQHVCIIEDITERLRIEEELAAARLKAAQHESEQRYMALVDQDVVGVAEADLSGQLTYVNDRYCRITGHQRADLIGCSLLQITHAEDRERNANLLEDMLTTGQGFMLEKRYVSATGQVTWAFSTVSLLRDNVGKPLRCVAVVLDITERKQQELRLRQTLDLLALAERTAGAGAWNWDLRSNELYWSDELFRLWGLDSTQTSPSLDSWRKLLHPEDADAAEQAIATAIRTHQPLATRYRILLPSGAIRWIEAYGEASLDASGTAVQFTGLNIDVTQRKQTENLVSESERRFRNLFEHLPVAYQSLDIQGRWLDANQYMADLLGFTAPEDMLGLEFVDYWHEELRGGFTAAFDEFKVTQRLEGEVQLRRLDGKLITVIISGQIQRNHEGRFLHTHCLLIDITQRRAMEDEIRQLNADLEQKISERTHALQLSEARSREMLTGNPIAVLLIDNQGIICEANEKAGQLLRCAPAALIGCAVDELIPERQRGEHAQHRAHFAQHPEPRQMSANREITALARDGSEIPVEIGLGPVMIHGVPHVIAALNDISRRKQAEFALQESRESLQRAQVVAKVGSWKYSVATRLFSISEETRRIFELPATELIAINDWLACVHPEDRSQVQSSWFSALHGETYDITYRIITQNQVKWINAIAELTVDEAGNLLAGMGTVQDITALKLAEMQIRETMQYLKLATEASGIGIWTWDISSGAVTWDSRMHELYGISAQASVSYALWRSCLHPDDMQATEAALHAAVEQQTSFEQVFRIILPDGQLRTLRPDSIFERDSYGNPLRMIGVNQDISEYIAQQETLRIAKQLAESANEAKSSFLANMSHEIRTPMNAIIGLSQLVLDSELTRQQREYLGKVQAAGKALLNLINDILDYSKIEAGYLAFEKAPFRPVDTLRHALDLFQLKLEEKGLQVVTELDDTLPEYVIGDSLRLGQVLNNLLSNAIKFTSHGSITISIATVLPADDPAQLRLQFRITDTGIGIAADLLQDLFTPFTQADASISRRFGGTGLGLSISKRIVELMGGEISVSSREGEGSCFSFTAVFARLPMQAQMPELPAVADSQVAQGISLTGAEILLVEDNSDNQLVAQGFLHKLQLKVTLAENGREAVRWVQQKAFDAILMDIQMPVMDGYEATRQIRALPQGKLLPIIALSASVMLETKQSSIAVGMNDHLAKPIDPEQLTQCLLKWLSPRAPFAQPKPAIEPSLPALRPIEHELLQPLLSELSYLLTNSMLRAKKLAEQIDEILAQTALAKDFFVVSDLVRQMDFDAALLALTDFVAKLEQ